MRASWKACCSYMMEVRSIKQTNSLKHHLFKNKHLFVGAIFFSLIISAMNVGLAFILQILIDLGVYGEVSELVNMAWIIGGLLLIYLLVNVFHYKIKNIYVMRALISYKDAILGIIIKKNLADFRKRNTGSYISVINNDVKSIETDYVEGNLVIITQVSLFIMGLAAMFYLNPYIAIAVIVLSILPILATVGFNGKVDTTQREVSSKNEGFTTSIKDIFNGFTVIKSFGVEKEVTETIADVNKDLESKKRKLYDVQGLIKTLTEVTGFIMFIGTIAFGVWLAIMGDITVGEVVAYIQLINYMLGPIIVLSETVNKRKAGAVLITKIDTMLLSDEQKEEGKQMGRFQDKIVFKDVSFSFDGEKNVLSNLNLELEKNKSYAVVGLSGSGKSTMLNVLMGYYDSYQGSIHVDGNELKEISPASLYENLSVIQQEVFMFDAPLKNNIQLYKTYPPERLAKAISMSGLDEFIKRRGEDFDCGENGTYLSGGEKQRVSIARALIKDTPILLLDEATSSLDNETARAVEKSILELEGTTRIIVTHKLNSASLAMYDEIIMMKNGEVVEKGSFEQLLERKGMFYSLYNVTF